jgi:hypothetical protein
MTGQLPEQSWVSMNVEWYEFQRGYPVNLEAKAHRILMRQPGWIRVSGGLLFDIRCTWYSGERQRWHCIAKFDIRCTPDGKWEI